VVAIVRERHDEHFSLTVDEQRVKLYETRRPR